MYILEPHLIEEIPDEYLFPYNALDGKVMVHNGRIGCFSYR